MSIRPSEVTEPERVTRMQHEIVDRIAAIPGVASVAFTSRLPMDTSGRTSSALFAEGKPDDGRSPSSRQIRFVSPGMFRMLGTPLIAGSEFRWIEIHDQREVAILSENLAREMWGSPAAALGKRIREGNGVWRDVVGVTGDVYDQSMARTSFTLVMLAIAGAMALLLGVFGLSGVIAYAVSQRRREIGIRMALGARAADILGLFVRRGLALAIDPVETLRAE